MQLGTGALIDACTIATCCFHVDRKCTYCTYTRVTIRGYVHEFSRPDFYDKRRWDHAFGSLSPQVAGAQHRITVEIQESDEENDPSPSALPTLREVIRYANAGACSLFVLKSCCFVIARAECMLWSFMIIRCGSAHG